MTISTSEMQRLLRTLEYDPFAFLEFTETTHIDIDVSTTDTETDSESMQSERAVTLPYLSQETSLAIKSLRVSISLFQGIRDTAGFSEQVFRFFPSLLEASRAVQLLLAKEHINTLNDYMNSSSDRSGCGGYGQGAAKLQNTLEHISGYGTRLVVELYQLHQLAMGKRGRKEDAVN